MTSENHVSPHFEVQLQVTEYKTSKKKQAAILNFSSVPVRVTGKTLTGKLEILIDISIFAENSTILHVSLMLQISRAKVVHKICAGGVPKH